MAVVLGLRREIVLSLLEATDSFLGRLRRETDVQQKFDEEIDQRLMREPDFN